MLLLHQIGSVKVGEIVRYSVTYTPSQDRILPSPEFLFLRIRNCSAIAMRAAFVHGPYTLSVSAYPSTFDPNEKFAHARRLGVPEFEPMLKAGGSWTCRLVVPEDIRQSAGDGARAGHFGGGPEREGQCVSWVIEVVSQVIFSASAAVSYEVLLARDEKSLSTGSSVPVLGGTAQVPQPGKVSDYQRGRDGRHPQQPKGVFSKAIRVKVEDTAALWNKPQLPGREDVASVRTTATGAEAAPQPPKSPGRESEDSRPPSKQKKIHMVILTHGLHSNLGGDMLFLKESIDATVRQAKVDRKARRAKERAEREDRDTSKSGDVDGEQQKAASARGKQAPIKEEEEDDEDEDEETIVRGFAENATRTERGIKFLGKRLARYVLQMTYPDQPYLPAVKSASETVASVFHSSSSKHDTQGSPAHKHSVIHKTPTEGHRAYRITKISFVGHSLGGLVQTYAVAYVQKHSPQFFDIIKPINFVALASPFLGLNHENPLYVKFALDFGLVGRTGQDLGLTWRAPTIARSGWGAMVSNFGENAHKKVLGESQPESKPLLRILPTGPAHIALKKFRNRTVYSNVVNDGIVPLRTSCLLFLDWQGLGRVDKARRETGLVETLVGAGWAELTGANVTSPRIAPWEPEGEKEDAVAHTTTSSPSTQSHDAHEVPQPSTDAILEDDRQSLRAANTPYHEDGPSGNLTATTNNNANPFTGFFKFFKGVEQPPRPASPPSQKQNRIYKRSQTLKVGDSSASNSAASSKSKVTSGHELAEEIEGLSAPPRTTFFESATDLINPKLPSVEYLIDPTKRPRTIFHDRIYHPSDIPPAPLKQRPTNNHVRRKSFQRTPSSSKTVKMTTSNQSTASDPFPSPDVPPREDSMASSRDYDDTANTNPDMDPNEVIDSSNMKVEEKIARAYHRGLSWRKVLVKLEPDAHNNLIVRRMFANAFGWPVIKHLADAHFSDTAAARMRDEFEPSEERAKAPEEGPDEHGKETSAQTEGLVEGKQPSPSAEEPPARPSQDRTDSEAQEARDTVPDLPVTPKPGSEDKMLGGPHHSRPVQERHDSVYWSDRDFADSEDSDRDEDMTYGERGEEHDKNPTMATKELPDRSSSPLARPWNWTEKIVGKGATANRSKSPKSPGGDGSRLDDVD